jgi:hypothetical protein
MGEIARANRGNALFRTVLLVLLAALAVLTPARAVDEPQMARIPEMSIRELDGFVSSVAVAVSQDTLKLRAFAQTSACLELVRAANSFALAYTALSAVRESAAKREDKEAPIVRARAVQTRVTTFAARVRAEEYLAQRCRTFVVPAEHAGDPRYATPSKVPNADYTEAVIDARQAAETNLAIAVAAGLSGKCPEAIAAGQNITLLLPYIQKLLADTEKRPEVLGPRASRRGLEVSRRQLVAALDKLQADFGEKCRPVRPDTTPATEAPPPPAQ